MIHLLFAICMFTASPIQAVQIAPLSAPRPEPSRTPFEEPPKPVGIIPRNRGYEVFLWGLFDDEKKRKQQKHSFVPGRWCDDRPSRSQKKHHLRRGSAR